MLIVSFRTDPSVGGVPKILFSRISPPIFIDSRLAARSKIFEPKAPIDPDTAFGLFDPSLLVKEYVKKIKGKGKKEEEAKIGSNLRSFYDYLTAPNIRKKTKNLLFFILKFYECLKVYFPAAKAKNLSVDFTGLTSEKRNPEFLAQRRQRRSERRHLVLPGRRTNRTVLQLHQNDIPRNQIVGERKDAHYVGS